VDRGTIPSGRAAWLTRDGRLILAARAVRTFAYGFLSVLLGVYLEGAGYRPVEVGALLTVTLAGSAGLTLLFSVVGDWVGRRRLLILSAALMGVAGLVYALTTDFLFLVLASLTGTIGATSGEVGPFLALEQAILPQTCPEAKRTAAFGWYNTLGSLAGSAGALCGAIPGLLDRWLGIGVATGMRGMFYGYAALAAVTLLLFVRLSAEVEAPGAGGQHWARGLGRSRRRVWGLAGLFGVDSLAGGFVVQSLIAYWFYLRWGAEPEVLGPVFLFAGLLQAGSFLAAAWVGERIGLINTMVFTHLPSNVFLMLVPAAPSLGWAVACLLARQSLSQMDVPTRQSYTMAVVDPEERTAAAGITTVARNVAQALSPILSGYAMQVAGLGLPFLIGGGLKIAYDLALYATFRSVRPPEER
jgi:MFS family permease